MTRAPLCAGLLLALLASPVCAQNGPGTESALILQLSPAPRAVALGDAYVALSGGLALFHNPAGLAGAPTSVSLAYQTLPTDASAGLAYSAFRLGRGGFALGFQFVDYGSIDEVKPDASGLLGVPTGVKVSGGEVAASLGYGVELGWLRIGAAARVLRVDIADVSANTGTFDIGVAANLLGRRVVLAGAVQNMGGPVTAGRSAPLPLTERLGLSIRGQPAPGRRGTLVFELASRRSDLGGPAPVTAGAGVELAGLWEGVWFLVRGGYRQRVSAGDAGSGLAVGGGIRLGSLLVDYAYRPMGPLGATHHFGLTYVPKR